MTQVEVNQGHNTVKHFSLFCGSLYITLAVIDYLSNKTNKQKKKMERAVLKYTPFVSHLNHPNEKKIKIKTKYFCSQMIFPFILKIFFIYNIVFTWSSIIYTKLTSGTV